MKFFFIVHVFWCFFLNLGIISNLFLVLKWPRFKVHQFCGLGVRRAAVYSLGKLAGTRPGFATLALDHLADMFNDEMPEVCLGFLYCLSA